MEVKPVIAVKHEYVACGLRDELKTPGWTLEDGTEILQGVKDVTGHYVGDVDLLKKRGLRLFDAVEQDGAVIGFVEVHKTE